MAKGSLSRIWWQLASQVSNTSASKVTPLLEPWVSTRQANTLVHGFGRLSQCSVRQRHSVTTRAPATPAGVISSRHSLSETESRILGTSLDFEGKLQEQALIKSHAPFLKNAPAKEKSESHPDGTTNEPGTCVRAPGRLSIQESYEPEGAGFGGGPANSHGLQLKSYRTEEGLEAEWIAAEYYMAFPGVVAGGIVGCLLETQGNWTAAIALMDETGLRAPPLTVTKSYRVDLLDPTPTGEPIKIRSKVLQVIDRHKVKVEITLHKDNPMPGGDEILCATASGVFVKIGAIRDIRAVPQP